MTKEVSRSVNMNGYESYMRELAQQMRSELTENGFKSLETSDDVKGYMNDLKDDETTFVVINSTCGCAAGLARPAAVAVAEQNEVKPTNKVTVLQVRIKKQHKQCVNTSNKCLLVLHMPCLKGKT